MPYKRLQQLTLGEGSNPRFFRMHGAVQIKSKAMFALGGIANMTREYRNVCL
jgi:hypothetical protein